MKNTNILNTIKQDNQQGKLKSLPRDVSDPFYIFGLGGQLSFYLLINKKKGRVALFFTLRDYTLSCSVLFILSIPRSLFYKNKQKKENLQRIVIETTLHYRRYSPIDLYINPFF